MGHLRKEYTKYLEQNAGQKPLTYGEWLAGIKNPSGDDIHSLRLLGLDDEDLTALVIILNKLGKKNPSMRKIAVANSLMAFHLFLAAKEL